MLFRLHGIQPRNAGCLCRALSCSAWAATQSGAFKNEIIPTGGHDADGVLKQFSYDEVIRPETTVEALSPCARAFDPVTGTVTAGTSSALSDGAAAAMLVMSESRARRAGLNACVPGTFDGGRGLRSFNHGYGPVPASKLALKKRD